MTELVRDHVRLREVAGRADAPGELVEETEVQIHLLIRRTIEGTGRRLGESAPGLNRIAKQGERRAPIARAQLFRPRVLYILRDMADKVDHSFLGGCAVYLAGCADALGWR